MKTMELVLQELNDFVGLQALLYTDARGNVLTSLNNDSIDIEAVASLGSSVFNKLIKAQRKDEPIETGAFELEYEGNVLIGRSVYLLSYFYLFALIKQTESEKLGESLRSLLDLASNLWFFIGQSPL